MTDARELELHRVCLEWAEANRAAGRPIAIGEPYYLVDALIAALDRLPSSGEIERLRAEVAQLRGSWLHVSDLHGQEILRREKAERECNRYKELYDAGVSKWSPVYKLVLNERDKLRAELAEARKDAERFRFALRHNLLHRLTCDEYGIVEDEELSEHDIDAALAKEQKP